MKNLTWAILGLVLVIIVIFVFASRYKSSNDTLIPTSSPEPSAGLEVQVESTMSPKKQYSQPPQTLSADQIRGKKIKIKTSKGDILFELFEDAPKAASNFLFLTNEKFYDGLTFHRREENFVIQGGDPLGNGTGGPGYRFDDEPVSRNYTRGIVAMANAGPNTNGSQFFIMLADTALPKQYTVFGNVVSGIEVVDQIKVGDVMEKVTVE